MSDEIITELMEIIDESKNSLNDNAYLKLCNGLKKLYWHRTINNNFCIKISCKLVFVDDRIEWSPFKNFQEGDFYNITETQLNSMFSYLPYTIKEEEEFQEEYDCSKGTTIITFQASTIKQHMENVLKFEKYNRPKRIWFGHIDNSHIYYEGLRQNEDNTFSIIWGS